MVRTFDFLVIGGGVAGASAAYALSGAGKVGLLEKESQAGFHSTARSAAVHSSAYGPSSWQIITSASLAFFESPPAGFCTTPLTKPLGALYLAASHEEAGLRRQASDLTSRGVANELIAASDAAKLSPTVRMEPFSLGLYEPGCVDLDANAILQGFLRLAKASGTEVVLNAEALQIGRRSGVWRVETAAGTFEAPMLINAAGGWADQIAERAGLQRRGINPFRRTAITFAPPAGSEPRHWPMTFDVAETWYFKPEGSDIMMSPADLLPMAPGDAQPEELDIAVAIDRIETATTMRVGRLASRWAGMRTFAPDHEAVIGPDPQEPSFVWYAGQGGNGVMGAPAGGEICAALATGRPLPAMVADLGLTEGMVTPARLDTAT